MEIENERAGMNILNINEYSWKNKHKEKCREMVTLLTADYTSF